MIERPEKQAIVATIFYGFFGFLVFPFILRMMLSDSWNNMQWRAWFEFGCHLLHFLFALVVFHRLLLDSFLTVQVDVKGVLGTAALGVAMIFLVSGFILLAAILSGLELFVNAADWMLPIFENELVTMADYLVEDSPVLGLICLAVLAPVGVSCIFYAVSFAPACEDHPLLAYLVVAVVLAIPRVFNVLLFQPVSHELTMYLFQLPLHWIACWTYQKTDTIWTPITVLSATNLLCCLGPLTGIA